VAKEWTLTKAFAHYGTRRHNPRSSWSARNEDTKTVVVAFWSDRFNWKDKPMTYAEHETVTREDWQERFGNRERVENFAWAMENCDGIVRVVMVWPKHPTAIPREIQSCAPKDAIVMRVVKLDPQTGTFLAEAVPAHSPAGQRGGRADALLPTPVQFSAFVPE